MPQGAAALKQSRVVNRQVQQFAKAGVGLLDSFPLAVGQASLIEQPGPQRLAQALVHGENGQLRLGSVLGAGIAPQGCA